MCSDRRAHLLLISAHLLVNQSNQSAEITDMDHRIVVLEIEDISARGMEEGRKVR
jgi:hypothetical protein